MNVVRMASPGIPRSQSRDQIFNMLPRGLSAHGRKHVAVECAGAAYPHSLRPSGCAQSPRSTRRSNARDACKAAAPKIRLRSSKAHRASEPASVRAGNPPAGADQPFLLPQVHSEVGRVLTDEVNFPHSLGDEIADFRNHGFDRATPVTSAHLRDHAKTARMIAALGNLHVGGMGRGKPEPRRVVVGNVSRPG